MDLWTGGDGHRRLAVTGLAAVLSIAAATVLVLLLGSGGDGQQPTSTAGSSSPGASSATDGPSAPSGSSSPRVSQPSTSGPSTTTSVGAVGPTATSTARPTKADSASEALCRVSPAQVAELIGAPGSPPAYESLRDGLGAMQDRVDATDTGSTAPAQVQLQEDLRTVLIRTRAALAAYDSGRDGAARRSLTAARQRATTLGADLSALGVDVTRCPA